MALQAQMTEFCTDVATHAGNGIQLVRSALHLWLLERLHASLQLLHGLLQFEGPPELQTPCPPIPVPAPVPRSSQTPFPCITRSMTAAFPSRRFTAGYGELSLYHTDRPGRHVLVLEP